MKKFLKVFGSLLIIAFALIYISPYNYILIAVSKIYLTGHTTAFLDDYKHFDNRTIAASKKPQPWPLHHQYNTITTPDRLKKLNSSSRTVAYLIIKNDSLLYEKYFDGFEEDTKSNGFSMVKSIVSTLLGKAIMEGAIEGLEQPVSDFFPELKGPYAHAVTVGDLSSMASGLDWEESYYSPFTITTESYFTDAMRPLVLNQAILEEPGKTFQYKSGVTQLLGMVIEKATAKNLSQYLHTHFWEPMGFESEALWQLDSKKSGMEKAMCCLASNARDFARFGKLYKNQGSWNGSQLLDSVFVAKVTQARFKESPQYGYGWWLKEYKDHHVYMMNGLLGQYVIVVPEKDLIIVRLGHDTEEPLMGDPFINDLDVYLDTSFEMTQNVKTY